MNIFKNNKAKKFLFVIMTSILASSSVFGSEAPRATYPEKKVTMVGWGISNVVHALLLALQAQHRGEKIRVTVYEKNPKITDTTAANICASLTADESSCVVPSVERLLEDLKTPFDQPGGILVRDVPGIHESASGKRFLAEVAAQGKNPEAIKKLEEMMLLMGKMSMDLWAKLYAEADPELREIFEDSNLRTCREPGAGEDPFGHGYRIDLLYEFENPEQRARSMIETYKRLGYQHCRLLSPEEVMKKDPTLRDFCEAHSVTIEGKRQWKPGSMALLRPGGCLNARVFVERITAYLAKRMGTYVNARGQTKPCFQLKLNRPVSGVKITKKVDKLLITGLKFLNGYQKKGQHAYTKTTYLFAPGESVGTLEKLGFKEPAYAGFAGASLTLNIKIPPEKKGLYKPYVHWMEVHKPGIVMAWQSKLKGGLITVVAAGTKSFYAEKKSDITQEFARNRNLLQLNMINAVVPWVVSLALGRDTRGTDLTPVDMETLKKNGQATCWAGMRSVSFGGTDTISYTYLQDGQKVENGIMVTHLGSGGVSFAPVAAVAALSLQGENHFNTDPTLIKTILQNGDARRVPVQAL